MTQSDLGISRHRQASELFSPPILAVMHQRSNDVGDQVTPGITLAPRDAQGPGRQAWCESQATSVSIYSHIYAKYVWGWIPFQKGQMGEKNRNTY